MEWAVCTASSDSEDTTSPEVNEEKGTPSIGGQQDSLHESLTDILPPTDLMVDNKAASTGKCWDAVQWSAWATSNYPTTRELNEEEGTPSIGGQQNSLQESLTDIQPPTDLMVDHKAASTDKCWDAVQWSAWVTSNYPTSREINEEEGELSNWGQQDPLKLGKIEVGGEYPTKDTQQPTDLMIDNEAAATRNCRDPVQWTGWEASSYPGDAATLEINEKEGEFSSTGHHDSLNEQKIEVEESTTNTAQQSIDMMIANEIASIRNCWSFMGSVNAEAKLPDNDSRDLIQFKKKQGSKPSGLDCMGSTCKVNISAKDGSSKREFKGLTMQMLEDEDGEEKVLVPQEDSEESAEELEFSTNGVSQKLYLGRSEVQRKKRYRTEDGLGQASKLIKKLQHHQDYQMPCASTACGESSTDPFFCYQSQYADKSWYERWLESYQTRHLEGIRAARDALNCTESQETFSRSSELVGHQEECTTESKESLSHSSELHKPQEENIMGMIYRCKDCKITFKDLNQKRNHHRNAHKRRNPYKCSDCSARFLKPDILKQHLIEVHNIYETFDCAHCKAAFSTSMKWSKHHCATPGELPFKCKNCFAVLKDAASLSKHWIKQHGVKVYKCTECPACYSLVSRLRQHQFKIHNMEKRYSCPSCPKTFIHYFQFKEHRSVHAGEVKYKCKKCIRTFESNMTLNFHQITNCVGKVFKCPHCPEQYTAKAALKRHKKSHHKEKGLIEGGCSSGMRNVS